MTDAEELDAIDRRIARDVFGWEWSTDMGAPFQWTDPTRRIWQDKPPSPTRNPADTAALEDRLWDNDWQVTSWGYNKQVSISTQPKTGPMWCEEHESRAIALSIAVIAMLDAEGKT